METKNFSKKFQNGVIVEFGAGRLDDFCVYKISDGIRRAPLDSEYFEKLKYYAEIYGSQKIYDDFVSIYDCTSKQIDDKAILEIENISNSYDEKEDIEILFTILYMAMIAEENKENSILGKRIKRLGIYKILIEDSDINHAANFMRGMGWREIDALCKERGF